MRHVKVSMNFAELTIFVSKMAAIAKHAYLVAMERPTVLSFVFRARVIALWVIVRYELIDIMGEPTVLITTVPVGKKRATNFALSS